MYNSNAYDEWNHDKKEIQTKEQVKVFINVREIWFTKMGKNIGFEENGKDDFLRPVLVIKKVGTLFFTIALTSKGKEKHPFYHKLKDAHFNENNQKNKNESYAILSQVRVVDKKRFTEKMGITSESEFETLKQKLKTFLF